jgi:hypothetical protein
MDAPHLNCGEEDGVSRGAIKPPQLCSDFLFFWILFSFKSRDTGIWHFGRFIGYPLPSPTTDPITYLTAMAMVVAVAHYVYRTRKEGKRSALVRKVSDIHINIDNLGRTWCSQGPKLDSIIAQSNSAIRLILPVHHRPFDIVVILWFYVLSDNLYVSPMMHTCTLFLFCHHNCAASR